MEKSPESIRKKNSKLAQVVQNFFTKTSQVIVQARSLPEPKPSPYDNPANSESSKINKWFNLYMSNLDSDWVRSELQPWKSQSDLASFPPMIIETYLDLRQLSPREMVMLEDDSGNSWTVAEGGSKKQEVVLERWLIEFDKSAASTSAIEELPLVYKQAIVLLRVLYGAVRLLPSYKLKKLVSKSQNKNLVLKNRFLEGKQPITSKRRIGLSKPIIPHQMLQTESHITQREFSPIQTSLGTLRVSVAYRNHYKFSVQHHEDRLSNHFITSDKERAEATRTEAANLSGRVSMSTSGSNPGVDSTGSQHIPESPHGDSMEMGHTSTEMPDPRVSRGSFDHFREKYSVSPCTSEHLDKDSVSKAPAKSKAIQAGSHPSRPSIQPFKVGSIGSSPPPNSGVPMSVQSSSLERRISITSNRSGSNASLVALLRNPRTSTSSSNTPNAIAISHSQSNTAQMARSISSSHGSQSNHDDNYQDYASTTPRFSSSFGSRQSRHLSNVSAKASHATEHNQSYFGTSVDSNSSGPPFSGLYADDDISSFVQMIDGKSDLRLSSSNQDSKQETPTNDSSSHFEALGRFQLLKSQYQQLSDSVNASLVLQHTHSGSRSGLNSENRSSSRKSSHSAHSPAPSLPVGSYDNSHLPSISSRLSRTDDEPPRFMSGSNVANSPANISPAPSRPHDTEKEKEGISGLATSPSVYKTAKQAFKYEDVFEDGDEEGPDYFVSGNNRRQSSIRSHDMSYDNDDLLFEMTDTR